MQALESAMSGLKKGRPLVFNSMAATLLIICLAATGCALIKLKKENAEVLASTVLVGRISTAFPGKGPIIVAAYTMNQGKREVVHFTVLHDLGEYELMVAKGTYYVFAYWDKNSNLIYDDGEPAGQYGDPEKVIAPAGGVVGEINIAIPEKAQKIDVPSRSAIYFGAQHGGTCCPVLYCGSQRPFPLCNTFCLTGHPMGGRRDGRVRCQAIARSRAVLDRYATGKCVYPIPIPNKNAGDSQLLHVLRSPGKPQPLSIE